MPQILSGGCLCGNVKYEISGDLFMAAYCHCSMRRKAHGSAFRPRSLVWSKDFRWVQGNEAIGDYSSSPGVHRTFCRNCGSPLIAFSDQYPTIFNLPLGTLATWSPTSTRLLAGSGSRNGYPYGSNSTRDPSMCFSSRDGPRPSSIFPTNAAADSAGEVHHEAFDSMANVGWPERVGNRVGGLPERRA